MLDKERTVKNSRATGRSMARACAAVMVVGLAVASGAQSGAAAPAGGSMSGSAATVAADRPGDRASHRAPNRAPDFAAAARHHADSAGLAMLVMIDGKVVFEQYEPGTTAQSLLPLYSGSKSFVGVLAMAAVQDGLITLDERISDTITEWRSDARKMNITVRQLLDLSSGLAPTTRELAPGGMLRGRPTGGPGRDGPGRSGPDAEDPTADRAKRDTFRIAVDVRAAADPGERFAYGPSHYFAFGEFLTRKLRASTLPTKTFNEYLQARLFDHLGLKASAFRVDAAGNPDLPGGARMNARDWARFGQFVLDRGSIAAADGARTQIIDADLLAACFVPSRANPAYGLTWWLLQSGTEPAAVADRLSSAEATAPGLTGPDGKPIEVYMAAGAGKQRLYVIPQWNMVVVRLARFGPGGRDFSNAQFLAPLLGVDLPKDLANPATAPQAERRRLRDMLDRNRER